MYPLVHSTLATALGNELGLPTYYEPVIDNVYREYRVRRERVEKEGKGNAVAEGGGQRQRRNKAKHNKEPMICLPGSSEQDKRKG